MNFAGLVLKISFAKYQQPTQQQPAIESKQRAYGNPQNGLFTNFIAAIPDGSIF